MGSGRGALGDEGFEGEGDESGEQEPAPEPLLRFERDGVLSGALFFGKFGGVGFWEFAAEGDSEPFEIVGLERLGS